MNQRGQADFGIGGLIALLVLIAIGALVVYEVTGVALDTAEEQRVSTTTQLLNTSFTDNTGTVVDNWDNAVENAAVNTMDTSSGYVLTTVTDNGDPDGNGVSTTENGFWWQAATLAGLQDGLTSATVTASFRVIDNDNLEAINSYIYLDDGTDNTEVWTDNSVDNAATWTSVSVDVSDNIDAAGTYTLYLYTEILPDNDGQGSNIVVAWTAANLSIVTYSQGYMENAVSDVEERGATVFSLATILAIVLVAALIIGVVMRAIGGAVGGGIGGEGTVPPAL